MVLGNGLVGTELVFLNGHSVMVGMTVQTIQMRTTAEVRVTTSDTISNAVLFM